ncbi:MAG: hypothetical protein RI885_2127, partial [Actinomycetota bacterium]
ITGAATLRYLSERAAELDMTFAVGARDLEKVRRQCSSTGVAVPTLFQVDVTDDQALASFARRGSVLINLVGPYSFHGDAVVTACVEAGTSYVDLTAETQFLRRTDARWHETASRAGVAIVQTAGFEALPADLAVELARDAVRPDRLVSADLQLRMLAAPGAGPADGISGGTAQSIVAILGDVETPALDDVAFRITDEVDAARTRIASPNRLWPRIAAGQVIAPMVPAAFINPPVIHRSSWLHSREIDQVFMPLRYRDGMRFGGFSGARGMPALLAAEAIAAVQALVVAGGRLPYSFRRILARVVGRVLPQSGTGPTGPALDDWRWRLDLVGLSDDRRRVDVQLDADGHPGYVATARMIAELALIVADGTGTRRVGCITPALALGAGSAERFARAGLRFSVTPPRS